MAVEALKTAVVVLVLGATLALLPGGETAPAVEGGKVPEHVLPVKKKLLPSGKSGKLILFILPFAYYHKFG